MDQHTSELLWIVERLLVLEIERDPSKTKRDVIERWENVGPVPARIRALLDALK